MNQNIQKIYLKIIVVVLIAIISSDVIAQDTLAGNYPLLTLKSGIHIIKETVTVKVNWKFNRGQKLK